MSLDFFWSLPQRQHNMQNIRKLKKAQTFYLCSLYIHVDQPVNNFFDWCLFLILHTNVHFKKAKFEICSGMFYPVITVRCLPGLIMYCGQF